MTAVAPRNNVGLMLRWLPLVVCGVIAALTMALAGHEPSYDPWSWLVWARQLSGTSLVSFDSMGASGWKPLPVLVQVPFNWFGPDVAPVVWVWIVRTGTFMIPVVAWRLGRIAAGYPSAVLAALATLAVPAATDAAGGLMEPLVALFLLIAVEQAVRGRSGRAWVLGLLAALGRPEVLAAVAPFGVWASVKGRLKWYWVAFGLTGTTLLWMSGDWIDRGKPFALLERADKGAEPLRIQAAAHPGLEVINNEVFLLTAFVLAAVAFIAALRWKDEVSRLLGLTVLLIGGATALATEFGYPAVPRYLWPMVPIAYALLGIGVGRLVKLVPQVWGKALATIVAGGLLVALLAPLAIKSDRAGWDWYMGRERATQDLPNVIASAGGRGWIVTCGSIVVAPSPQVTAGVYALDVQITDVARGAIYAVHSWGAPQVVFAQRKVIGELQTAVRQRGLKATRLGSSRLWVAYWVGTLKETPCRRGGLPRL